MGIIYKHTINNKSYIGYTKYSLEYRLKQHINAALSDSKKKSLFCKYILKYGKDKITSIILEECDNSLMPEREKYWINELDTFKNGLNLTLGGDGGPLRNGMKNSKAQKLKSSITQKGKPKKNKGMCGKYNRTAENRDNISKAVKGKIWVSHIENNIESQISKDLLEKYISEGFVLGRKCKDYSLRKGQVVISDKQKKQISKAITGRIHICNYDTMDSKMIFPKEFDKYKNNGYIKGRLNK